MKLPTFVVVALLLASSGHGVEPPPPEIQRALYGTVLLVTTLDKGLASYGSGIVLDKSGLILTNLHVLEGAKAVHALAYDPDKPSYAAVDGGLDRLVFERQADLVPVSVIRGDPVVDLAVVRLEKPASVALIPIATEQPAIGAPVIAIGHPEQNFWTLTRGQISALHNGMLQHDAALNKGNSGGPLLNAKGELVGVNTTFLKGTQGIFYARPIGLANKLVDIVKAPLVMDRSTPEKAVMACARARELGDPSVSQCIHWGSHYALFRRMIELFVMQSQFGDIDADFGEGLGADLLRKLRGGPKTKKRALIKEWLDKGDGRADVWVKRYGPLAMQWIISDDPAVLGRDMDVFLVYLQDATRGGRAAKNPERARTRGMTPAQLKKELAGEPASSPRDVTISAEVKWTHETGLKVGFNDVAGLRKTLKMGLRVEKTQAVSGGRNPGEHAWVALGGRNLDGTPYHYSVLLKKEADGWREETPTVLPEMRSDPTIDPPKGFPPALNITGMPLGLGAMLGAMLIAVGCTSDDPEGISVDFDFEHTWPLMMELMRANTDEKTMARTADAVFKLDAWK